MAVLASNRSIPIRGGEVYVVTPLANGDSSQIVDGGARNAEVAWQVTGTFGAAGSIQLEKSNNGVDFVIAGTALTAAGMAEATTSARFLRFRVTAGDGTTALTATLFLVPAR